MWTGSAGDQFASAFYGMIDTATGVLNCASAGQLGIIVVRGTEWESLSCNSAQLGEGPDASFEAFGYELQPGEALVVFTDGVRDARDKKGQPLGESGVAEALLGKTHLPADQMAQLVRERLDTHAGGPARDDATLLVVKHTPA